MNDVEIAFEMLMDVETRIGELLPAKEEALKTASTGGKREKRMEGISMKRAVHARAIAKHPEIVEKVKAQARENEDIPKLHECFLCKAWHLEKRPLSRGDSRSGRRVCSKTSL